MSTIAFQAPQSSFRDSVVSVSSPARLHFGLLNESGLHGRIDGGLGLAIQSPRWHYELCITPTGVSVIGSIDEELRQAAATAIHQLSTRFGMPKLSMRVLESIPAHVGLGSKTSLLVSLSRSIFQLANCEASPEAIASSVQRGGTSGVGVHLSTAGGLVVDIGRSFPEAKSTFGPSSASVDCSPPKLMMRTYLSGYQIVHWRYADTGLSGLSEKSLFQTVCPVAPEETLRSITIVFSQIIPACIENNDAALQQGMSSFQKLGLKRHEWLSQTTVTSAFQDYFHRVVPNHALCLSSMGPTMFVMTTTPNQVLNAISSFGEQPLHLEVTQPDTVGAAVIHSPGYE